MVSLPNIIILLVNMLQILMKRRLHEKPRKRGNGNNLPAVAPSSGLFVGSPQNRRAKGEGQVVRTVRNRGRELLLLSSLPCPYLPESLDVHSCELGQKLAIGQFEDNAALTSHFKENLQFQTRSVISYK